LVKSIARAQTKKKRRNVFSSKLNIFLKKMEASGSKKGTQYASNEVVESLNSLFWGPPVRSNKVNACCEKFVANIPRCPPSTLEDKIDQIIRERLQRHERMWSMLDTPKIIMPIFKVKDPQAKRLC